MGFLVLILAFGAFAYLTRKYRMTTLTRNCRWRLDREAGVWTCAFCNESLPIEAPERAPTVCMDPSRDHPTTL